MVQPNSEEMCNYITKYNNNGSTEFRGDVYKMFAQHECTSYKHLLSEYKTTYAISAYHH